MCILSYSILRNYITSSANPSISAVTDVAGVVVDVGPGVNGFQAGDQVVAMLNSFVRTLHSC